MIAAGINAKALSTYMGHASVVITYDLYGHLMPGNEAKAGRLLDALRSCLSSNLKAAAAPPATTPRTLAPRGAASWQADAPRLGAMSPLEFTVAVLPPFTPVFEVEGQQPSYGATWDQLPRVRVDGEPSDTLREVLRRACTESGVRLTDEMQRIPASDRAARGLPPRPEDAADHLVYLQFRRPDDDILDHPDPEYPVLRRDAHSRDTVAVVRDERGRAVWRKPGLDATIAELIDAAEAGLLDGDPFQPYLIPSIPQGDLGGLAQWDQLKVALDLLWKLTLAAGAVEGAVAFSDRVRELLRRRSDVATDALERNAQAWVERNAAPRDLVRMLAMKPRTTAEVAGLLGCSTGEAEAILWALGFAFEPSGEVWVHRGDETAHLIASEIDVCFLDPFVYGQDDDLLEEVLRDRLTRFLESGEAPSYQEAVDLVQRSLSEDLELTWIQRRTRHLKRHLRRIGKRTN
jgi:hypothetical protein